MNGSLEPAPGACPELDPSLQREVLFHSLIVSLTRYVPLPFLDDAIRQVALKRMYAKIAEANQRELTRDELKTLAEDRTGCCQGCLLSVLLWPFRKILARILFLWDIKKTIDLASVTYVQGYLLHVAFQEHLWSEARMVRDAIDAAAFQVGTSPIEHAFQEAMAGAQRTLKSAGHLLARLVRRRPEEDSESNATQVLDAADLEERKALGPLLERLAQALRVVPASYFQDLCLAFRRISRDSVSGVTEPPSQAAYPEDHGGGGNAQ